MTWFVPACDSSGLRPKLVAEYLDARVTDVTARWPEDVVEVSVEGEPRWVLSADAGKLTSERVRTTRLLGPFDLFLQARDRPRRRYDVHLRHGRHRVGNPRLVHVRTVAAPGVTHLKFERP